MTLFDVDKTSADRGTPDPNRPDQLLSDSVKNHGTLSVNPVTNATPSKVTVRTKNNQVAINDGNQDIAIFGQQADGSINLKYFDANGIGLAQFGKFADGTIALKVAKSGIEVSSATNDQLIFNSSQDVFKIVGKYTASFSFTTSAGETTASATITHNLGYVPTRMSFLTGSLLYTSPTNAPLPYVIPGSATATGLNMVCVVADVQADTSTIGYSVSIFAGSGQAISGTITAYILQETAN